MARFQQRCLQERLGRAVYITVSRRMSHPNKMHIPMVRFIQMLSEHVTVSKWLLRWGNWTKFNMFRWFHCLKPSRRNFLFFIERRKFSAGQYYLSSYFYRYFCRDRDCRFYVEVSCSYFEFCKLCAIFYVIDTDQGRIIQKGNTDFTTKRTQYLAIFDPLMTI